MMFQTQRLTKGHLLNCPSCGNTVLEVQPERSKVPGGGTWMRDGDTVPGLFQMLSDAQKTPDGFDYELMVGRCRSCRKDYYGVFANFMQTSHLDGEPYLSGNTSAGPEINYQCTRSVSNARLPEQWVLHEHMTEIGLMHCHVFGPFTLDSTEDVEGPLGVAGCGSLSASAWEHARTLLYAVWDSLREYCKVRSEANPTIASA